jgi:SNF family Na+-dependent transporter
MTSQKGAQEEERETWGGKLEFLLSCIGYCVGLGNVWRFPYLAYQNGGGVFFIPYFLMLFICGIPIFLTELSMGQYSSSGTLGVWKAVPAFKGIGYAMILVSFYVMVYYNIVIAYSIHYLFSGMQKILPWSRCDEWWNTAVTKASCSITQTVRETIGDAALNCKNNGSDGSTMFWKLNETFRESWLANDAVNFSLTNEDKLNLFNTSMKSEPAEEYWVRRVLQIENDATDNGTEKYTMDNLGSVVWDLFGCNLAAWVLVFFCLFKGVQSSGKVVYVTATFPYLVLVILVAFGATLDGAKDGIEFYLKPDLSKLSEGKVWSQAATQIFYSLGVAFGGLMTMSSYNKFDNNILRDTLIVSIGNCFSSVFAGFGVFSFLGHMAYKNCMAVEDVVKSGPGLAFIAYPEAMSLLPASQLFSVLFFIMLVTLGLDSQFAMVDVCVAACLDEYPHIFRKGHRKTFVVLFFCVLGFLLGIPILTNGGLHFFNLINDYSAWHGLLILAFLLSIVTHYVYQFVTPTKMRFVKDIEEMIGNINIFAKIYFYAMWFVGTPVMLLFIIGYTFANYQTIAEMYGFDNPEDGIEIYPAWCNNFAMVLSFSPVSTIVIYAVYSLVTSKGASIQPTDDFGPAKPKANGGAIENQAYVDPSSKL